MASRPDNLTEQELVRATAFDSREPAYLAWKREKIEAALRHADEHPDDFLTEKEVWKNHGLAT